jgi:hypothetical protein
MCAVYAEDLFVYLALHACALCKLKICLSATMRDPTGLAVLTEALFAYSAVRARASTT